MSIYKYANIVPDDVFTRNAFASPHKTVNEQQDNLRNAEEQQYPSPRSDQQYYQQPQNLPQQQLPQYRPRYIQVSVEQPCPTCGCQGACYEVESQQSLLTSSQHLHQNQVQPYRQQQQPQGSYQPSSYSQDYQAGGRPQLRNSSIQFDQPSYQQIQQPQQEQQYPQHAYQPQQQQQQPYYQKKQYQQPQSDQQYQQNMQAPSRLDNAEFLKIYSILQDVGSEPGVVKLFAAQVKNYYLQSNQVLMVLRLIHNDALKFDLLSSLYQRITDLAKNSHLIKGLFKSGARRLQVDRLFGASVL